ncbi:peptidase M24, structural domain-containing protein [Aspergillus bertholletiae]|uniref:Xaa-Pro aminopeptidase n=1 Tax=Aspergillus bertholletiae TaxID=1226010 RepID=A0A5N7BFU8_9EURO|nr:peptidase M24, structural domain-containing protein [Aspergillus bertholletiae]
MRSHISPSMCVSEPSDVVIRSDDTCHIRLTWSGNEGDKYPAKQHARKVAMKLGVSSGLIYLVGQPTVNWGDSDQPQPFRQRRYFYYLSGIDEPDCYLTYDIRADLLTLYVPDFDLHRAVWMGPTLTIEEAHKQSDVDRVNFFAALQRDLEWWTTKNNGSYPIYILHDSQKPAIPSKCLLLDNERLLPAMNAARVIKDDYELRMIRQANHISGLAHRKILEDIHRMSTEADIESSFLATCVSHGAKNQSYAIIAGSGENAAVLHYVKNNEPLDGRQLVCLDAGAEWKCYASDVTRTIPLWTDWPSERARNIYRVVEEMQEACIKRIRKGVRFRDLQLLAHDIAIKGLQKLDILTEGSINAIYESGASAVFFPHGLGHHVGLEVHDVSERPITALDGNQARGGNRDFVPPLTDSSWSVPLLDEGMVVTIEPGIYFNKLALLNAQSQPLAKYINFEEAEKYIPVGGVRIEDDILVTAEGYENLTTAPKGEEMLEIIRRGIDNS